MWLALDNRRPPRACAPPRRWALALGCWALLLATSSISILAQQPLPAPSLPQDDVRPEVLRSPFDDPNLLPPPEPGAPLDQWVVWPMDPPLGFAGPSGILPAETQSSPHFVPIEDRWRLGFPEWDRYGKGHPPVDDYPYVEGAWWDPYNQNVLKGDYPILGQHTFFRFTGRSQTLLEGHQVPTPTTPFESTRDPFQAEFFGDPDQY